MRAGNEGVEILASPSGGEPRNAEAKEKRLTGGGWPDVEGEGKGVQALGGVLHRGEERLVVVLVVGVGAAAAAAPAPASVAVGTPHLPHSRDAPPRARVGEGNGLADGWMWPLACA